MLGGHSGIRRDAYAARIRQQEGDPASTAAHLDVSASSPLSGRRPWAEAARTF